MRQPHSHGRQKRFSFAASLQVFQSIESTTQGAVDLSLTGKVAADNNDGARENKLRQYVEGLENSGLAREDTFCHDSMTRAERVWLREHRSPTAAHWNLLTDLKGEHLAYASP